MKIISMGRSLLHDGKRYHQIKHINVNIKKNFIIYIYSLIKTNKIYKYIALAFIFSTIATSMFLFLFF